MKLYRLQRQGTSMMRSYWTARQGVALQLVWIDYVARLIDNFSIEGEVWVRQLHWNTGLARPLILMDGFRPLLLTCLLQTSKKAVNRKNRNFDSLLHFRASERVEGKQHNRSGHVYSQQTRTLRHTHILILTHRRILRHTDTIRHSKWTNIWAW